MTASRRNLARHKLGNAKHGGWMPDRPKAEEDWLLRRNLAAAPLRRIRNAILPIIRL
jgi:hypothetical protein